jgi:hypothetical protein
MERNMLTPQETEKIVNQIQTYQDFEQFVLAWIDNNKNFATPFILTKLTNAILKKMSYIIKSKIDDLHNNCSQFESIAAQVIALSDVPKSVMLDIKNNYELTNPTLHHCKFKWLEEKFDKLTNSGENHE